MPTVVGAAGTATSVGSATAMPAPSAIRPSRKIRVASPGSPSPTRRPWLSTTPRSQMLRTVSAACVTRRMVRPSFWNSLTRPMHLRWKRSSPTARTSSIDQDVGVHVHGDREAEPHVHAGRVELHRAVDELLQLGEVHDGVEDLVHVALGHPHQRTVQVDVLPAGQVLLEAGTQLQQPGQLAPHGHLAIRGLQHAADALEQGRLARAVAAQDADGLPFPDGQRDAVERPEVLGGLALAPVDQPLLDRLVLAVGQAEALRDVADVDREIAHALRAPRRSCPRAGRRWRARRGRAPAP